MSGDVWERLGRRVAAVVFGATASLVIATLVLAPVSGAVRTADDLAWILGAAVFGATGWVIARRHPHHRIGWAFLWIGFFFGLSNAGMGYAVVGATSGLPLDAVAGWLSAWSWAPPIGLLVLVMAIFPTGRPVNRAIGAVAVSALVAALTIATVNATVFWPLRSPRLALPGEDQRYDNIAMSLIAALFPVILLAAVVCLASLLLRFRRATGTERQQLKWVAVVAVLMGPAIVLGQLVEPMGGVSQVAEVLSAPAWLAVAAGFAVLRYRLFDVDRILSRTVSYALVTAVLIAVYAGSVLGLGGIARAVTGESGDLVVALSTLLVAAAFQPVRGRVQGAVDRRFNRARVDGLQAVEEFGRRLRDEVELTTVVADLRRTAVRTLQPSSTSVVTITGRGERA